MTAELGMLLLDMASTGHGHTISAYDHAVAAEMRAQMAREAEARRSHGDLSANFTQGELADLAGMPVHQVRRRLRGETPFTVEDLVVLSEALGIEGHAMLQAAMMRMRHTSGTPHYDQPLRDQVLEGPGGLPIIQ